MNGGGTATSPFAEAEAKLKRRRAELDLINLRRQILSDEIDIEAMLLEIEKKKESIAASGERAAKITEQFHLGKQEGA